MAAIVSSTSISSHTYPGGVAMTITGSGFTGALGVRFSDAYQSKYATSFVVVNDTSITCITPTGINVGTASFSVRSNSGSSAGQSFTILPNYTLTGIPSTLPCGDTFTASVDSGFRGGNLIIADTTTGYSRTVALNNSGSVSAYFYFGLPIGNHSVSVTFPNNHVETRTVAVTSRPLSSTQSIPLQILTVSTASTAFRPVTAVGGNGGITYTLMDELPPDLSMNGSGFISGTPRVLQTSTVYSIKLTDETTQTAYNSFSIGVAASGLSVVQNVSNTTLSTGTAITPFTPITVSGGFGIKVFTINPALPANLAIDSTTGQISGTALYGGGGTVSYTVAVTDEAGQTQSRVVTIAISNTPLPLAAAVNIEKNTLVVNQVADPYIPVRASGGIGPLIYTVSPSLPTGLTLNGASGEISGTPTQDFTSKPFQRYVMTITDSIGTAVSKDFYLYISNYLERQVGSPIKRLHYNVVQTSTVSIIGPNLEGYGQADYKTHRASTNELISADRWEDIYQDVNRIHIHQYNRPLDLSSVGGTLVEGSSTYISPATTGTVVYANFRNLIANTVTNYLSPNRFSAHPAQLDVPKYSGGQSVRTDPWETFISHEVQAVWLSEYDIRYFFNCGGYLIAEAFTASSRTSSLDLAWSQLIESASPATYSLTNFLSETNPVVLQYLYNGDPAAPTRYYKVTAEKSTDPVITIRSIFVNTATVSTPSMLVSPTAVTWYLFTDGSTLPPVPG
jgi:hypothetical protein